MRPVWHILASFILGLVIFYFSKSLFAGFLVLLSGVFIDLDHLMDFWASAPENAFSIKQFYHMDKHLESKGDHYTFILLHSWEIIIVLTILVFSYYNIYLASIVLGVLVHLIMDTFNLKKTDHPFTYFLLFRVFKKFKLKDV